MTASRALGLVALSVLVVGCRSDRTKPPIDSAPPTSSPTSTAARTSPATDSLTTTDSLVTNSEADSTVAVAPAAPDTTYYPDCPFECCKLGDWSTEDSIPVYAEKRSTSAPMFFILPHEHFTARDSAKLYTNNPGVIRFRAPVRLFEFVNREDTPPLEKLHTSAWIARIKAPVAPGESLLWVGHCSECGERAVFAGDSVIVWQFWTEPGAYENSTAPAILERPLDQEWWVRIVRNGRFGWIQAFAAHHLSGHDACA